jgi:membrane-bound lytic murein transglycosylase D
MAGSTPLPATEPFPEIEELRPNVAFWRDVFALYGLGQVVVHDVEHPGVVYEVVSLPGEPGDRYTREQREFVRDLRESWEARLLALGVRARLRQPLDDDDKRVALLLTTTVGTDALEGAHRRVRTQRGLRERFRRGLEVGARYEGRLREVFRAAGLPEDLALLPHVESSFQWAARSSAGAVGAWQFTRGTGRNYMKINLVVDERLDPIIAGEAAALYLGDAYEKLGCWALAITSYNHGVQGMQRARSTIGGDFGTIYREYRGRAFGFASRNFYAEFIAAREIALRPERYFPEGLSAESHWTGRSIRLDRPTSARRLAAAYGVPLDELAALNPAWRRRAVERGIALPVGSRVWLPEGAPSEPLATEPADADTLIHIVDRGDTLSRIAREYGVLLDDLLAINGLSRRGLIHPGQEIHIPVAR